MNWRGAAEPMVRPALRLWWRVSRGMTLGVRAVVEDRAGRIVLVRHTYMPGWHLPGGGVERDETAESAIRRELQEEAGVDLSEPPCLVGVYANLRHFRGDHVLLYRGLNWTACKSDSDGEIEAIDWFAPDALPEDASAATRRRLLELYGDAPTDGVW